MNATNTLSSISAIPSVRPFTPSTAAKWTARIVGGIATLLLTFDTAIKLFRHPQAVEGTAQLGFPPGTVLWLGVYERLPSPSMSSRERRRSAQCSGPPTWAAPSQRTCVWATRSSPTRCLRSTSRCSCGSRSFSVMRVSARSSVDDRGREDSGRERSGETRPEFVSGRDPSCERARPVLSS